MPAVPDPIHEGVWILDGGTMVNGEVLESPTITGAHSLAECDPHPCVLHSPSDHPLRDAPMHWRDDLRVMERICEHRRRHPDPDDVAHKIRSGEPWLDGHDCDGCCAPRDDETKPERAQKIY